MVILGFWSFATHQQETRCVQILKISIEELMIENLTPKEL